MEFCALISYNIILAVNDFNYFREQPEENIMSLTQTVETYLQNEEQLYQDWARLMNELDADDSRQLISLKSSLEELKAKAKVWIQGIYTQHYETLCVVCRQKPVGGQTICEHWCKLKAGHQLSRIELLVGLIVDFKALLDADFHPSHAVVVSTLMVTHNMLDNLCGEV